MEDHSPKNNQHQHKAQPKKKKEEQGQKGPMGALATAVMAIAGLVLGWAAIELAFKPYLQTGRDALNKSLDPNYDVDDELDRNYLPSPPCDDGDEEEGVGEKEEIEKSKSLE